MTHTATHHLAAAALAAALALAGAGCSKLQSDDDIVASAQTYLDQNDVNAATIQLKALLQRSPDSGPGRLLLGRALLAAGDPVAAVVELAKARELGVPDSQVLPPLARGLLATGEHVRVTSDYAQVQLPEPQAAADLLTSVATAYARQGELEQAARYAAAALQVQPGYAMAVIVQAQLKASERDVDGALLLVEDVLALEPGHERAGVLKGELLQHGKRDRAGALAAYRKVVEAHPKSVPARVAVITLLRLEGEADEAKAQVEALRQAAPNHPETVLQETQQALLEGDSAKARDLAGRLLKAVPDHPGVLFLAGLAEFRLRSYAMAEAHLSKALKSAPGYLMARQLLAQTYLRSGQPGKTLETLAPVLQGSGADGGSLALAGEAHLALGDMRQADEAFKRAGQASPDDPRVRVAVALSQVARGNPGAAVADLEAVASTDKGTRADLALITARMRSGDLPGALKAVESLRTKMPDRALPDLLQGRVLQARNDVAGARAAYEAAVKKDPKFFPAVAALAGLDVQGGQPADARKRLTALVEADPGSSAAHIALAELTSRQGGTAAEVARQLEEAIKASPGQARPRLVLVQHWLSAGDAKAALAAAQAGAAALPSDLSIQEALGRAQMASGDARQAQATFTQLVARQPGNPVALVRLAEAQTLGSDFEGAGKSLRKALEIQPTLAPAKRALAAVYVAQGKPAEALTLARELQRSDPKDALGFVIAGDVERLQRNWPAAIAAMRSALANERSTQNAVRLHQTLLAAGKPADAELAAQAWLRDSPQDAAFRFYLGDIALAQRQWAQAEQHYRAVMQLQPGNGLAVNNVAWLMLQQGKPGAVAVARQANELLPGRPALMDTLASALAAEGQLPKAIELQKEALARAPQDPKLRLNLARLLIQAGDKPQARAELEDIARLGDRFAGQDEVERLLKGVR